MKYLIILSTRKEDLGDQNLEMFMKHRNKALYNLADVCSDWYFVFNCRVTGEEEQRQADELLQTVVGLVQQNGGRPCSFRGEGTQRLKSFSRCF